MPEWTLRLRFLGNRGLLALVGLARTVMVLRILSPEDYALLGVTESVRLIVTVVVGLGISDAIAREGARERDPARRARLMVSGLILTAFFSVIAIIVMLIIARIAPLSAVDPRIGDMLLLASAVVVTERFWGYLQSCLQALLAYRLFAVSLFCHGIFISLLTVISTYKWGVGGYFVAQAIANGLGAILLTVSVRRNIGVPGLNGLMAGWARISRSLWPIARYAYSAKCSLVLWRRLPIVLGANFIPAPVLGAIVATLDLTSKVNLANEALAPITLPKLTRIHGSAPHAFYDASRRELRTFIAINLATLAVASALWLLLGQALVGYDRWHQIQPLFFLGLGVEVCLLTVSIVSTCVIVPSGNVAGLAMVTLMGRVVVTPAVLILASMTMVPEAHLVFAAMGVSGLLVAFWYVIRARVVLREYRQQSRHPES